MSVVWDVKEKIRAARSELAGYVEMPQLVRALANLLDVVDKVAEEAGLQPATTGLEGRCSMQLSYSPDPDNSTNQWIKGGENAALKMPWGSAVALVDKYGTRLGLLERDAKGRLSFRSDADILTEIPLTPDDLPTPAAVTALSTCKECESPIKRRAAGLSYFDLYGRRDWIVGGHKAEPVDGEAAASTYRFGGREDGA